MPRLVARLALVVAAAAIAACSNAPTAPTAPQQKPSISAPGKISADTLPDECYGGVIPWWCG